MSEENFDVYRGQIMTEELVDAKWAENLGKSVLAKKQAREQKDRRDSFAMAALSGMDSGSDTPAIWARWAYQVADAMEIERNKLGKDDT